MFPGFIPQTNYNLTVVLDDVNDNTPIFTNVPYLFTVEEEQTGALVGSVSVSILDFSLKVSCQRRLLFLNLPCR